MTKDLIRAVKRLHASKHATYGPSWKKRGEQISIMANIARKVDRLERVASGAPVTADESLFDTAIDLFVYCVKYQTFLAERSEEFASQLFAGSILSLRSPYSDFTDAFDYVVDDRMSGLSPNSNTGVPQAARDVTISFQRLENCFLPETQNVRSGEKHLALAELTNASMMLIAALWTRDSSIVEMFIAAHN